MKIKMINKFYTDDLIKKALLEDISYIDVTTDLLIPKESVSKAYFLAKADGVLAGLDLACRVFELLGDEVKIIKHFKDGDKIKTNDKIAELTEKTSALLKGERTALNLLGHLSGIATVTSNYVEAVHGTQAKIADTRKTLPNLRPLQKYAVLCGGGFNHRFNLSDCAMLKNNHIDACGGITEAVKILRAKSGHTVNIEVEVRNFKELNEALEAGVKLIMLDNMSIPDMKEAVKINNKRAILEASGNITLSNVREVAETGVDIISVGALTHSAAAFDISLRFVI